ncbi:hypothetical protein ACLE20_13500 [Rhizobium sp. YIM 134829]|uniref:hypothetical protein n=1 Tax=Rhizobium sp. YIM 134829 TaxID=3390453 RepID=UPI00397A004B
MKGKPMDVAQLGVKVTSEGVSQTSTDLDKLTGSATRAEGATERLASANRGATGAASAAAKAYAAEGASAASASRQIEMMARAANSNTNMARGNISNLAAQVQDTIISAQGGMAALTIGLQQGTQTAMVLASMDKPIRGLAEAFMMVLSPVSLITIGMITLVAALVQMVNWSKATASALRVVADHLVEIAPYAVGAAAALALLYAPAIIGGVVQLIALLGRLAVQAIEVGAAFAIANPGAAFVIGIMAAVAAAVIFRDELAKILGVDIVAIAKQGANLVIGSFVAAYHDIEFVWKNFGDILGASVTGAVNAAITGINRMVSAAAEGIDKVIGLVNKIPGVNIEKIGRVGDLIDPWENEYAERLKKASTERRKGLWGDLNRDYLGDFGSAIKLAAAEGVTSLQELIKWLEKTDEKTKKGSKGRGGKTEEQKYSDITDAANRRIASLRAEQQALGMTDEAASALRHTQDLLNEAAQRGITLTPQQTQELVSLGGTMAAVETQTERMRDALEFAKQTSQDFFQDVFDGITKGEGLWKSFANAAIKALQSIASELLKKSFNSIWDSSGIAKAITGQVGAANDNSPGGATAAAGAVSKAMGLLGQSDRSPGQINSYLKQGGVDIDAARTAWCAGFVNSSLKQVGVDGTGSLTANSFLNWGSPVAGGMAQRGDVLVQSRGLGAGQQGGHVGFATGGVRMFGGSKQLEMLSGNSSNSVQTTWVEASQVQIRRMNEASTSLQGLTAANQNAAKGLTELGSGMGNFGNKLSTITSGGGSGLLSTLTSYGMSVFAQSGQFANAILGGGVGLFAKGGISDRPAIFGEAGPEAAVPLPDGRRIPVDLRGRDKSPSMTFAPVNNLDMRGSNWTEAQINQKLDQRDRKIMEQVRGNVSEWVGDDRERYITG